MSGDNAHDFFVWQEFRDARRRLIWAHSGGRLEERILRVRLRHCLP
jgi:hypothetical protein